MSKDLANAPAARTWRDIPQPVKPRAMSNGGRWRLAAAVARVLAAVVVLGLLAWGGWKLAATLLENPANMPAAAKAVPVRLPELTTDGVLDGKWLARVLALPEGASLLELDLGKLRARLLAQGQVLTANLTRNFPDRLAVQISERTPVAKVMAQWNGQQKPLLVARDGVVFEGVGFDARMVERLPWLDGLTLARRGNAFLPVEGMAMVAELLAKAQLEADHLYRSWRVIFLARLASDGEIEVRTAQGVRVVFSASGDYFRQLAKLDFIWEKLANLPDAQARIDLSLGREVPVLIEPVAASGGPRGTAARDGAAPTISIIPH